MLDTVKAEAERGPQYGYGRGGYNSNRGGYNGVSNSSLYANYDYGSIIYIRQGVCVCVCVLSLNNASLHFETKGRLTFV